MLVLNLPAFRNKKYTAYDLFHGYDRYDKILTKKEPIRKLGFALPYNNNVYYTWPQYETRNSKTVSKICNIYKTIKLISKTFILLSYLI